MQARHKGPRQNIPLGQGCQGAQKKKQKYTDAVSPSAPELEPLEPWGATHVYLVGVEGSSHHGMMKLVPGLNQVMHGTAAPVCLRVEWHSFPSHEKGLPESTRLAWLYGDSCRHGPGAGWRTDCAAKGAWRCGPDDPEAIYRELVFRFGTWPGLNSLTRRSLHDGRERFVVLRRSFLRSVASHAGNTTKHPWDATPQSHALVLAAFTSLVSAMLAELHTDAWITVDPDLFAVPGLKTTAARALVEWFQWKRQPTPAAAARGKGGKEKEEKESAQAVVWAAAEEEAVWDSAINAVYVASKKDPRVVLTPPQVAFVERLAAARRADGSWAAYEDPEHMLLYEYSRQGKVALGSEEWAAFVDISDYDPRLRLGVGSQSVSWRLSGKNLGPFPETCTAPPWERIPAIWPRDPS